MMNINLKRIVLAFMAVWCLMTTVQAKESAQNVKSTKAAEKNAKSVSFGGSFLTLAHWRNDTDFDASERYDDLDGQTEGQIASFLAPYLTIRAQGGVTVHYQAELGWNTWSRNTTGQPNQYWGSDQPGLMARHREAWGQWTKGKYSI